MNSLKNSLENQENIKIDNEREIDELKNKLSTHVDIKKQLIGLSFFVLIFIFLIPYFLFTHKYFGILEGYIPNVDMIATVLSFQREPFLEFKSYLKYLYRVDTDTVYGYFSQSFINYMALLGLTFFIAVAATNLFHQGNWQRVYAAKNYKTLKQSLIISFFIIIYHIVDVFNFFRFIFRFNFII